MRRNKTLERRASIRFRVVPLLLAGGIGYVLGGVNIAALQGAAAIAPADAISLRFPSDWNNPTPRAAVAVLPAAVGARTAASDSQLALLNPEPMVPPSAPQPASPSVPAVSDNAVSATAARTFVQAAALEQSSSPAANNEVAAAPVAAQAPRGSKLAASPAPAVPRRAVANRPGYLLDEAQIASIKERLHLTPDQEQMWPAVESALRNMRYAPVAEARPRGSAASNQQASAVDPNSVQGLKSAAVPLIMSFNDEQKQEVRNVAHVMGLDQLAQQF